MKMDKQTNKLFIILIILSALNFIGILLIFPRLPEEIPLHWGINGEIDNWGSKNFIFLFGFLPLIITVGMYYLPNLDPKKENYIKMSVLYGGIAIWFTLFLIVLNWIIVGAALNILNFDKNKVVPIIITLILGISFIVIGNYMPRIKQNWFLGVRTPWALTNNNNWKKTQRFSGYIFIFIGILLLINSLFMNSLLSIITIVLIIGSIFSIYLYSYFLYRKEINN